MTERPHLGRFGIAGSEFVRRQPADGFAELFDGFESRGVGAFWFGESAGDETFATAGLVLARSSTLVAATGIANMAARTPSTMAAGRRILTDAYPGRFALGVGVSHAPLVTKYGAAAFRSPLSAAEEYLNSMAEAPVGTAPTLTLVAALGPKMVDIAGRLTDGIHPFNVTTGHTAQSRRQLGAGAVIAPRVAVLVCTDASEARSVAREHLHHFIAFDNYRRSMVREGFDESELASGGSDRLVDAMVPWGSLDDVTKRVAEHWDAGADHVALQVLVRPGDSRVQAAYELADAVRAIAPS